jgi:uncharacterized protein with PQ loop repeat
LNCVKAKLRKRANDDEQTLVLPPIFRIIHHRDDHPIRIWFGQVVVPTLIEVIGWIGSILFALCGAPQAWMSYRRKNSHGLSWLFIFMWFFGELFTLIYIIDKPHMLPLILNYTLNILFLGVILWYKKFPRS